MSHMCAMRVDDVSNCDDMKVLTALIKYCHGPVVVPACAELVHDVGVSFADKGRGPCITDSDGGIEGS